MDDYDSPKAVGCAKRTKNSSEKNKKYQMSEKKRMRMRRIIKQLYSYSKYMWMNTMLRERRGC